MLLRHPRELDDADVLEESDIAPLIPAPDEITVRVDACGVCRTDLDVVEGRVAAPAYPVIPGHQIVGRVASRGREVTQFRDGDRVGVAWIHSACGHCRWCLSGRENLCPEFRSTGCDVDGGYAEYARVPAAFAYAIPEALSDTEAAPLLCAGAIGWRSLRLTNLADGEPLGLSGFGASAHLVIQLARARYPNSPVYVFARSSDQRAFAKTLGATWCGDFGDDAPPPPPPPPPERPAAIIDTTPVWTPVVTSLAQLAPGGRLVINSIRKIDSDKSALLQLKYETHLWREHEIKSVANVTRADVREVLAAAAESGIKPVVERFQLLDANAALRKLQRGDNEGAMVLVV